MTNITESRVDTLNFNSETKTLDITFNDLNILSTGGVDVLVLNLNEWNSDIPFYLEIDQRLFALQPSNTHLVSGHGAQLPNWITNEESEGRLTILVERNERYLVYIHDTLAIDEDEDEDDETIVEESTEETSE
ncbi:MAG: hypothetical protein CL752_05665 [Chloroflexi bacterium]|nr:hypothetical protein [Chloroflexota bacterium]|tara:strand:+ start:6269 stop:6667 length:399 start_codon:yes stop_codon:yes gene_type:complete